jgi:hypothetical protein
MKKYVVIEIYRHKTGSGWFYDYYLELTDELHGLTTTKKKIDTTRDYDVASVYHKFSSDPYIAGQFTAYWIKKFNLLIVDSKSRFDCYTIENDELKPCELPDNCVWKFRNDKCHYGYDLYNLATDVWETEFSRFADENDDIVNRFYKLGKKIAE